MAHTPGSILIVDDDATSRAACEELLRRDHHTVTTAPDGRRALEVLREQSFDLLLLDIGMPEVDGFEVLGRLRSEGLQPDLQVIMTSALDDVDSVLRCIDLGAHGYLLKPFDAAVLLHRVAAALRLRRIRASARAAGGERVTG
jgi:DNA-binding response OmpR family regulator